MAHPEYPRSPGMSCTLTPAVVRNWRIWQACSTTCSGMLPTITPNSMPRCWWVLGSGRVAMSSVKGVKGPVNAGRGTSRCIREARAW